MPTLTHPVPTFPTFEGLSDRDVKRATAFAAARAACEAPMLGDIIRRRDGSAARVAHRWGPDAIQPTSGQGSFHAFVSSEAETRGHADMSGSLDPSIALDPTEEREPAIFWFFRDGYATAHNGVYFIVPVRVWQERA